MPWLPISPMGCWTPISLLTVITDNKEVSGRMEASKNCPEEKNKIKSTHILTTLALPYGALADLARVPPSPPVHSFEPAGRWHWNPPTPKPDMSPGHTCAPSVWWSHGVSWTGRSGRRPGGGREGRGGITTATAITEGTVSFLVHKLVIN